MNCLVIYLSLLFGAAFALEDLPDLGSHFPDLSETLKSEFPEDRVYNGISSLPGQFPSAVLIEMPEDSSYCTGTIIGPKWVTTAKHCCEDIEVINVIAGTVTPFDNGPTKINKTVKNIYLHPNTNLDCCLLEMHTDFIYNQYVAPCEMATEANINYNFAQVTPAGFGDTNKDDSVQVSRTHQHTNSIVLPNTICQFDSSRICVLSLLSSICYGDSGSSLYVLKDGSYSLCIGIASTITLPFCLLNPTAAYYRTSVCAQWIESIRVSNP